MFILNKYMKVSFNVYNAINNYSYSQSSQDVHSQPVFGSAKARKLMEKIVAAKSLKYINATYEDMVAIYSELGFDVITKRGSHAVVPLTEKVNLPLVMPHGSKYVHPLDLKRLQFVIKGEFERALNVH